MIAAVLTLMLSTAVGRQTSTALPVSDLAAARELYAAGNYEDALSRLAAVPSDASLGEVDEYRALCLLALGRTAEAQRQLDDLVTHQPMFRMSETEISPRLVTMFRETRKRLLPAAARDLYTRARSDFDGQRYVASAAEFKDLLGLLADEDLAPSAQSVADLKVLAEGFATLADSKVAAAAAAPPPAPAPPTQPAAPPASDSAVKSAPAFSQVFSETDKTVEPPVAISTPYPSWHPPNAAANHEYHGMLRLVIDATGHVESAVMVVPMAPTYDPLLLAAAKDWTFKPAQLDGANVRYQRQISVALSPR